MKMVYTHLAQLIYESIGPDIVMAGFSDYIYESIGAKACDALTYDVTREFINKEDEIIKNIAIHLMNDDSQNVEFVIAEDLTVSKLLDESMNGLLVIKKPDERTVSVTFIKNHE